LNVIVVIDKGFFHLVIGTELFHVVLCQVQIRVEEPLCPLLCIC